MSDTQHTNSLAVAGLILAAGASARMGRPKQLLEYGGASLLRRAALAAVSSGLKPVVVVLGAEARVVAGALVGLPVQSVTNADWRKGMGTSIRAGIRALAAGGADPDAVVVMLCDQPLVSAEVIARLVGEYRSQHSPMVACAYGGTLGVPALFARACMSRLASLPDDAGAKCMLARPGDEVRSVPFPQGAWDIDTPADYAQLQAHAFDGNIHSHEPQPRRLSNEGSEQDGHDGVGSAPHYSSAVCDNPVVT